MSRRTLAVLLSVILATIGTTAVYLYLSSADSRAIAGKRARVVLVAAKRIPAGTTGDAMRSGDFLRAVRMPVETLPEDFLAEVDGGLENQVATATIQRGQLLLRAMFGQRAGSGGGVSLPDGMVAVPVKMKAFTFSPGLIAVGSKVAIFYTYTPIDEAHRDSASGSGLEKQHATNSVTRLLLRDVEVVAVSDSNGAKSNQRASGSNDLVVTVALNQLDAERLAHAVALGGELNIAMLGDGSKVKPDAGIDNRTLFS